VTVPPAGERSDARCPACGGRLPPPTGPRLTVDVVIERAPGGGRGRGAIVLVRRSNPPPGWALPGGFVDEGERVEDAARREALEETGLEVTLRGLLGVYSDPARDPRFHTTSVVYVGTGEGEPRGGDDAREARVFALDGLPAEIAFDHRAIIEDYRGWMDPPRGGGPSGDR
jgi:8-oxo-dGTP diphosphatase